MVSFVAGVNRMKNGCGKYFSRLLKPLHVCMAPDGTRRVAADLTARRSRHDSRPIMIVIN